MSINYCTFWYPTIYHQELVCLYEPGYTFTDDISDKSEDKYNLSIKIDEDENLIVSSVTSEDSFTVVLKRTDIRRNGFVQYSFETDDIPKYDTFKIVLSKDVYHLAKQFYHRHEADFDKDGALRAIITEQPEAVNTENNNFIIGFLKDYFPVFQKYAADISDLNLEVQKREANLDKLERYLEENPTCTNAKEFKAICEDSQAAISSFSIQISNLCENALIEYTYYKTLCCSKYNKLFQHIHIIDNGNGVDDQCRRQALNIRNSIRYIENIKYKNQNRVNRLYKYLLNDLRGMTAQTARMTQQTNEVLTQSKKTEAINSVTAWFSIFVAIMFGVVVLIDVCSCALWVWAIVGIIGLAWFALKYFKLYRCR